jgi:hypothetical protein
MNPEPSPPASDGHVHLTIGVLGLGLLVGTLYGPVSQLINITSDNITSAAYWLDLGAATIRSAATAGVATLGVVGAALGIPMWQNRGA